MVGIVDLGRVRLRGVVVDCTDNDAARPRDSRLQGCALQASRVISGFHVFHLTCMTGGDPVGEAGEFGEVADGSDAGEVKARVAGGLFDPGGELGNWVQRYTSRRRR